MLLCSNHPPVDSLIEEDALKLVFPRPGPSPFHHCWHHVDSQKSGSAKGAGRKWEGGVELYWSGSMEVLKLSWGPAAPLSQHVVQILALLTLSLSRWKHLPTSDWETLPLPAGPQAGLEELTGSTSLTLHQRNVAHCVQLGSHVLMMDLQRFPVNKMIRLCMYLNKIKS